MISIASTWQRQAGDADQIILFRLKWSEAEIWGAWTAVRAVFDHFSDRPWCLEGDSLDTTDLLKSGGASEQVHVLVQDIKIMLSAFPTIFVRHTLRQGSEGAHCIVQLAQILANRDIDGNRLLRWTGCKLSDACLRCDFLHLHPPTPTPTPRPQTQPQPKQKTKGKQN